MLKASACSSMFQNFVFMSNALVAKMFSAEGLNAKSKIGPLCPVMSGWPDGVRPGLVISKQAMAPPPPDSQESAKNLAFARNPDDSVPLLDGLTSSNLTFDTSACTWRYLESRTTF